VIAKVYNIMLLNRIQLVVDPLLRNNREGLSIKTDFYFADAIALVSNIAEQAQALLHRVKVECRKMGLRLNAKKTGIVSYITGPPKTKNLDETVLTTVEDLKYRG
jgi:hypothetical protein